MNYLIKKNSKILVIYYDADGASNGDVNIKMGK